MASEFDLEEYAVKINYHVDQINGCRHLGPPIGMENNVPENGSELFVGRLPYDCYEDELMEFFSPIGLVYKIRLMVTYQSKTRGYGFILYHDAKSANAAIERLNGRHIRPGNKVIILKSTDHRFLILLGIRPGLVVTPSEVEEVFKNQTEELISVSQISGTDKAMFSLHFGSHRAAAVLKRTFCTAIEWLPPAWGSNVRLMWQPNDEVDRRNKDKRERELVMRLKKQQAQVLQMNRLKVESTITEMGEKKCTLTEVGKEKSSLGETKEFTDYDMYAAMGALRKLKVGDSLLSPLLPIAAASYSPPVYNMTSMQISEPQIQVEDASLPQPLFEGDASPSKYNRVKWNYQQNNSLLYSSLNAGAESYVPPKYNRSSLGNYNVGNSLVSPTLNQAAASYGPPKYHSNMGTFVQNRYLAKAQENEPELSSETMNYASFVSPKPGLDNFGEDTSTELEGPAGGRAIIGRGQKDDPPNKFRF